jgi:hypothetical protein
MKEKLLVFKGSMLGVQILAKNLLTASIFDGLVYERQE